MIRLPMMMAANHLIYTTPRGDMAELGKVGKYLSEHNFPPGKRNSTDLYYNPIGNGGQTKHQTARGSVALPLGRE